MDSRNTDLEQVKLVAYALLNVEIQPTEFSPIATDMAVPLRIRAPPAATLRKRSTTATACAAPRCRAIIRAIFTVTTCASSE